MYSIQREYSVSSGGGSGSSGAPTGDQNSQQPHERKIVDLTANKFSGVGPVSQEGVPIALRSVNLTNLLFFAYVTSSAPDGALVCYAATASFIEEPFN